MNLPDRLSLAHLPTPTEPLAQLSEQLGRAMFVKRDDLTGSHLSGNKVRKLEFLLAEAVANEATHVITCGGVQSNHCRATALAAASLGMVPVLLLRTANGERADLPSPSTGNVLLGVLAGAEVHLCDPDGYRHGRQDRMAQLAQAIADRGGRPIIVPEGGSSTLGALGYVNAARELVEQLGPGPPTSVLVAVGSGGTLAGLAMGFKALGAPFRAIGIPVCDDAATFRTIVHDIAAPAARYGLPALSTDDYELVDGFQGQGYALTTPPELACIRDAVRRDGLVLDHVYTGKAFGALLDLAGRRPCSLAERVVFVHTGGIFGLAAAGAQLDELPGHASPNTVNNAA